MLLWVFYDCRVDKSSGLPAKVGAYLVSIGQLLCFTDGIF